MIRIGRDSLSPDLRRKLAAMRDPAPIWRIAAQQVVSISKRSFREPALRIEPWANKKKGGPSNLIRKGMLLSSIRIVSVDRNGAVVGTDRPYGAIHQLGGRVMPRRPFLPFTKEGKLDDKHRGKVQAIIAIATRRRLGL